MTEAAKLLTEYGVLGILFVLLLFALWRGATFLGHDILLPLTTQWIKTLQAAINRMQVQDNSIVETRESLKAISEGIAELRAGQRSFLEKKLQEK